MGYSTTAKHPINITLPQLYHDIRFDELPQAQLALALHEPVHEEARHFGRLLVQPEEPEEHHRYHSSVHVAHVRLVTAQITGAPPQANANPD